MPSLAKSKRHDEDDEDKPRRRRAVAEDDDDDDKPAKKKTTGKGWGALAGKTKETKERGNFEDTIREFWLTDGESAVVQFITEEPFCLDGHMVRFGDDKYPKWTPCQLSTQRHCKMCREGSKKVWKAVFKVLDYRGNWDKDKERFKHDEKIEKVWYVGQKLAEQIQAFKDKRGKELTELVFEVTRSGSGTKTTYNLEIAYDDEDDAKIVPFKYKKHKFPDVEEICQPLTDDELEDKDFSIPKDTKK